MREPAIKLVKKGTFAMVAKKAKVSKSKKKESTPTGKVTEEKKKAVKSKEVVPEQIVDEAVQEATGTAAGPDQAPETVERMPEAETTLPVVQAETQQAQPSAETTEEVHVNPQSLPDFLGLFKQSMELPWVVTGYKAFGWERPYAWGLWDKAKYDTLKGDNPSYADQFEITGFEDDFDDVSGLFAHVLRISDKKEFLLPLADLAGAEEKAKNTELLNEYVGWFTRSR